LPLLRVLLVILSLLPYAQVLAQQEVVTSAASKPVAKVAITLFHNRVYLPVKVNDLGPFEMILDTGAAASGLSEATAESVGLHKTVAAQLTGNGESRLKVAVAKNAMLRVGGAQISEKQVVIIPFQEWASREGRTIDGVLGVSLFHRFVVVIDYANKTLELYEPQGFSHETVGVVVPLDIGSAALFRAKIDLEGRRPLDCRLAVDSGTYSALRLYRPFVQKHQLLAVGSGGINSFGFGLGGDFPERLSRVTALTIGGMRLDAPTASFSDANSGATSTAPYDGTIGGEILSRFKVTFDYPHQQMILEPNLHFSEPFLADSVGMVLGLSGSEHSVIEVVHVLENTPAQQSGIQQGDIVVTVNNESASALGIDGIRNLFLKPAVYLLQLRRGEQVRKVIIEATTPLY
jgi:hypothetical protein